MDPENKECWILSLQDLGLSFSLAILKCPAGLMCSAVFLEASATSLLVPLSTEQGIVPVPCMTTPWHCSGNGPGLLYASRNKPDVAAAADRTPSEQAGKRQHGQTGSMKGTWIKFRLNWWLN